MQTGAHMAKNNEIRSWFLKIWVQFLLIM